MENQNDKPMDPLPLKREFKIKVIGVGGAGCNAVAHLNRVPSDGVDFAALNTDASSLALSPVPEKLILGAKSARGLGAGGDPERGRVAAEEDVEKLRSLLQGADIVFVIAGLGGGTGTGASPVVARLAKESGALVLAMVMLPFECEGARRQRQALLGLHELKSAADGVICLPNQKVFKFIDEKTSLLEAFQITNEFVAQGVHGIWRLLSRPGLINVDFADLCAITRGTHGESSLAFAEARGENRAREAVEKLMAHPLIEGGQALNEAAGALVCITGGSDMTMAEVTRVMEQINRHCEHAHIIMGAAIDDGMTDRLAVMIVASRRSASPDQANGDSTNRLAGLETGGIQPADFEKHFMNSALGTRPPSKFVAPPPSMTPEKTEQLYSQQGNNGSRHRKNSSRLLQGQLPLEIVSKGRFEKSEPTIHHGQDLDVPTYIRRGVALN
ncbi:MAG TPA: cell division protein FtsZ [Candidatus Saccharimonadales bacterium]|nr:cell division protein FtsZ [Candidatus Saccharimonadales bacterium]